MASFQSGKKIRKEKRLLKNASSGFGVGLSFRQCVEPESSDFVLKYLMLKKGYLYILASRRNGTLYVGVTSDLVKRIEEHRQKLVEGFTKKYEITNLVYFETFEDIRDAIIRERQIKEWKRKWKTELIQSVNPYWRDLYEDIL